MVYYEGACRGSLAAKAQAWKACGALPLGSSIPPLGAFFKRTVILISDDSITRILKTQYQTTLAYLF